jgi:hypothetical protein
VRGIYKVKSSVKLSAFLVALSLVFSCAAARSTPKEPWRVEVTTTGGLAGRGTGDYAVDHEGAVTAKLFNGKSCAFQLGEDELRRIRNLLAEARPRKWRDSYIPENPCCDRFEYTLTVDEAGDQSTTKWIDFPEPMPADLVALAEAIVGGEAGSIRMLATERCR